MEAQNKHLREISKQDQPVKDVQYKANLQIINEGWGILLRKAQQQITNLMLERKQSNAKLREMCYRPQEMEAMEEETVQASRKWRKQ